MFFIGDSIVADTLLRVSRLAIEAVSATRYVGLTMLVEDTPTTAYPPTLIA